MPKLSTYHTLRTFLSVSLLLCMTVSFSWGQNFEKKGSKKKKRPDKNNMADVLSISPPTTVNFKELADYELINPPAPKPPRNMEEDEEEKEHIRKPRVPKLNSAAKMAMPSFQQPVYNVYSPVPITTIQGLNDGGSVIPPDIGGAVGPNHLVETLNDRIRIFTKTGATLSTVTLDAFWAGTGGMASPNMFDPKVLYDPYNNRFIMTACGDAQSNNSAIFVAVTQTADPTGTWYKYRFDADATNTNWFDYPSIGFNNKWIVVTGNMFSNSNNNFAHAKIFVCNKANLYAGTGTLVNTFTTTTAFTICPAITYDNTASLNMYMVSTASGNTSGSGVVRLFTISGAVGSPSFAAGNYIYGPSWSEAGPNAPQQGTNNRISTNDDRMQNAVYRNGSLWCAHTVFLSTNYPNHSGIQWWQIDPATSSLQQVGQIEDSTGTAYYAFPSIAVNTNNDALIGFTQFSPNMYASAAYAYRSNADPANTMQVPYVYKMGEATYYKTFGGSNNRWGDYSSTCVDSNGVTLWTVQEYAESPANTWGTYWAKVDPQAPYCSGTLTLNACPGTFDDGSSSNDYSNNSNCNWLIQPLNATTITLNFSQFTVLAGDTVKVYDGNSAAAPLLGAFTGNSLPPSVTSSGATMFVKFTTNASGTAAGWAANYTCNVSNPGGQLSCNGLTTLTTCSGTVADGSAGNNYDDFVNCSWLISPSPAASSISLTFTAFNTESGYDSVKVYNGTSASAPLLGGYSGTTLPPTLTANSGKIFITFQSDAAVNAAGWSANYTCTPCATPNTPTISASPSLSICAGQSSTLTASVTGCTGCTYSWSNGTTGNTLTTSTAGNYTVTVTNGCGASSTSTVSAVVVNPIPTASASNTGAYCAGATIQLNSTGGGTYAWAGPGGFTSTLQNPTRANSTTAMTGTYTVTVTQNGCTNTATTNVTVNASPSASASNTGAYCAGATIQLNSTGGGTYAWAGPGGFTSTLQNPTRANSTTAMTGTYTVTVTQNGCTNTATTNVTVNAVPTANASNTGAYCAGATIQLNSTGGGTYVWAGPGGFTSSLQNPTIANSTTGMTGAYTVTVTQNGCTNTATTNVTVNATPTANASNGGPYCAGNTVQLNGSGGSSYSWAGPNLFTSTAQNPTIANSTIAMFGTYTVTVTQNGCTNTATTNVAVNAIPSASASNTGAYCEGAAIQLNGLGGGTYAWSGPNGFTSTTQNPTIANSIAAMGGTYTLTVTQNGCTNTATTSVTVNANPSTIITATDTLICTGQSPQLCASGTGTFVWTLAGNNVGTQSCYTVPNNLAVGNYTYNVVLTDANNCSATAALTVSVSQGAPVNLTSNSPVCEHQTLTLSATGGGTYSWSGVNGFTSSVANTSIANVSAANAGTYNVTVVDGNGCVTVKTITVSVLIAPVVTSSNSSPVCENANFQLSATGAFVYNWTHLPSGTPYTGTSITIPASSATQGTYQVIGLASNGCKDTSLTTVIVNALPVANAGNDTWITSGGSATLSATGGGTYSWSPATGLSAVNIANPVATPTNTTTYVVYVTSSDGCVDNDAVTVFVAPVSVENGFPFESFNVFPNPTEKELNIRAEGLTNGTYTFQLINDLGQMVLTKVAATNNGKLELQLQLDNLSSGAYYLQITSEKGALIRKVMKD